MTRYYRGLELTVADRADWHVGHVLRMRAKTHADKVYLDFPATGVSYTFAETLDVAERVAHGLLDRGHAPGDRIVLMLWNCPEYIIGWLGSGLAGMAEVPINTAYRGSFLEHQVGTVAPTGVVVSADLAQYFLDVGDACRDVTSFYVVGDEPAEVDAALEQLRGAGYVAEPFAVLLEARPPRELPTLVARELASVFFTSGTTGLSKGVMMSHAQMYYFAEQGLNLVRLTDDDTYLAAGPLFHGNSQFLAAYPSLIAGARFVLHPRFSASKWVPWLRESGATVTNLVGAMSDFIWKQPPTDGDADHRLRCIWAVPNPTAILDEWKQRFGDVEFVENFGLTETSMPILTPWNEPRPPGAAGLLVDEWFDIRLVDPETDEEVPVGEVGELVVRPKVPWTICSGYFGMPDRTAEAMRNCWFHTGDGLRRDEEGWYYFVDRLKDSLRRRGENISSYEVEQGIVSHPAVVEVAAVAVPADAVAGEDEVLVAVVLAEGQSLTAEEFWAHCDERLPYFAVPRYVRFVAQLPKTPSEKVRKVELRDDGVTADTYDRTALQPDRVSRRR